MTTTESGIPDLNEEEGPVPLSVSVGSTAARLQEQYLRDADPRAQAHARRVLAQLRRGAGAPPASFPLVAQAVLTELAPPLDAQLLGRGDDFSRSERAAFDALTLFALHMQSARRPAHVRGQSFGTAVGTLYRHEASSGSIKPRFDALVSARDERSRLTHARSLIQLLRAREIGFDYGRFAGDLRALSGSHRQGVLLRWSRDFATFPRSTPSSSDADVS